MKMNNYFNLEEFLESDTALSKKIKNLPSWDVVANLRALTDNILNPLREAYGSSVIVTSGYRSEALNKAVKGSKTSNHMTGDAADLKPADGDVKRLFNLAKKMMEDGEIEVGQLIDEYNYSWVHISNPTEKHHNQILHLK